MRRNALCLLTSVLAVVTTIGCKQAGKKSADPQTTESLSETYVPQAYNDQGQGVDSYAGDPGFAASERSYPILTPATEPPLTRYHTVVRHDTLYKLARAYYDDASRWRDIYEANRSGVDDPNKIHVGQRLLIP